MKKLLLLIALALTAASGWSQDTSPLVRIESFRFLPDLADIRNSTVHFTIVNNADSSLLGFAPVLRLREAFTGQSHEIRQAMSTTIPAGGRAAYHMALTSFYSDDADGFLDEPRTGGIAAASLWLSGTMLAGSAWASAATEADDTPPPPALTWTLGEADWPLLKVALWTGYAPYFLLDADNQPSGFEFEVWKLLALKMHRQVLVEEVDPELVAARLLDGSIDVIGACYRNFADEPSPDALAAITLSLERYMVAVTQGQDISTLAQLGGKKIGMGNNSPQVDSLAKSFGDEQTTVLMGTYGLLGLFGTGYADVLVESESILRWEQKNDQSGWGGDVAITGPVFEKIPLQIKLSAGNTALRDDLDQAIQALHADGSLAQLEAQWLR